MRRARIITVAVATILLAVALPIGGALYLANHHSVTTTQDNATVIARGLLRHYEQAGRQALKVVDVLTDPELGLPCSAESIDAMRRLELSSSYLQGVGYVENGRLACTGRGRLANEDLKPPDYTSARNVHIRRDVRLNSAPEQNFIIVEDADTGFAALFHGNLGFDLLEHVEGLAAGVVTRSAGKVIVHRGFLAKSWLPEPGKKEWRTFVADDYAVSIVQSDVFDISIYSALPLPSLHERLRDTAFVFLPIGSLVAAVLVLFIVLVTRSQFSMPAVLKLALRRNEFFMVYQPLVDLETRRCVGAEALVRWRRSDGEITLPETFIPEIESSGMMHQLTERVFRLVAADSERFAKCSQPFHISVNVAAGDLQHPGIVELVRRQIDRFARSGINVVIEATERGLINQRQCRDNIHAIRAAGAKMAVDDFGTGYSSLSYLQVFELDYLKIDKSFVDTIGIDSPTSGVVQHIIDIAHTLNLEAIAEGVTTETQVGYLSERGIRLAQGWLFSKPLTIDALMRLLENDRE